MLLYNSFKTEIAISYMLKALENRTSCIQGACNIVNDDKHVIRKIESGIVGCVRRPRTDKVSRGPVPYNPSTKVSPVTNGSEAW